MAETNLYQEQEHGELAVQGVNSEAVPLIGETLSDWSALAVKYRATRKCINSKAALLILFWSFIVTLGYGLVLNPDTYMQISSAIFPYDTALIAYGFIFIVLIFCPLAGYLADVKFGRHKTVFRSLYLIVLTAIVVAVAVGFGLMMVLTIDAPGIIVGSIAFILAGIASIFLLIGFTGFIANVLQFALDQLHSPAVERTLFIHWYVWVHYVGVFITQLSLNIPLNYTAFWNSSPYYYYYTGTILSAALFFAASLASVCLGYYKQKWFLVEPCLVQHQNAVINTGHVTAILKVLLSFGMVFFLDFGANSTLPLFAQHNTPYTYKVEEIYWPYYFVAKFNKTFTVQEILINSGVLSPLLVVICIPLYLFLLRPFIPHYIPGMLNRMGIGMCLVLLSLILTFTLDTATHYMHKNSRCMFKALKIFFYNYDDETPTLPPSPLLLDTNFNYVLVVQNILSALSNMLIYIAVFEFICSQSPHSRKGLLIGLWYAIKGLYQMFAATLVIPYIFWSKPLPSCGFYYYVMNILVGVFALLVYMWVARRYKYRDPDYDPRIEP